VPAQLLGLNYMAGFGFTSLTSPREWFTITIVIDVVVLIDVVV